MTFEVYLDGMLDIFSTMVVWFEMINAYAFETFKIFDVPLGFWVVGISVIAWLFDYITGGIAT